MKRRLAPPGVGLVEAADRVAVVAVAQAVTMGLVWVGLTEAHLARR